MSDNEAVGGDWPFPMADQVPVDEPDLPVDDIPQWLVDEFSRSEEEEHAAWLASLPDDVRADYLAGPYTGAGEAIAVGFTHRDGGGPSGAGFAAGGVLDRLAPGPPLADELDRVTAAGYERLTDSEQIGVLLGWQRLAAWAQAGLAAAADGVRERRLAQSRRPGWSRVADHITDELAMAMRLTTLSAGRLLGQAAGLRRLPAVRAALAGGQIDWAKACLLVAELAVLTDEQAAEIANRLLHHAAEQTTAQLRTLLARDVLAADPHAAERRKKAGRKDTRVEVWREPSGNAVVAGRELRHADAIAADAQLASDARWLRRHGAPGTLTELRAAAFISRLSGRDLTSMLPAADAGGAAIVGGNADNADRASLDQGSRDRGSRNRGSRDRASSDGCSEDRAGDDSAGGDNAAACSAAGPPGGTINLTMPLSAFAGLSDRPGEAGGHGAIDAATCRDLADRMGDDARWCLTLTGPDGRAVAHACGRRGRGPEPGRPAIRWAAGLRDRLQFLASGTCSHSRKSAGYAPPLSLRHLIEVRQRTCFAPGCRRPAGRCDIDHTVPFSSGGITCECNTAPGCRRHHRCKQAPGWRVVQARPGVMTWRLPGGRSYTTTSDPYPV